MNQTAIAALIIFGTLTLIAMFAINQLVPILQNNPQPAWFMLGFGSCMLFEGIVWWFARLYKRHFP